MCHRYLRLLFAALALCAGYAAVARAEDTAPPGPPASAQTLFTFRHVVVQTATDNPEVCLRFSQILNASADAHYGDYLGFSPTVKTAIRVTGTDLCISGLDTAQKYSLTIRHGLPAASGAKLATDQSLDIALTDQAPLVAIAGDGFILSRNTTNGLAIQTVNVRRVKIRVLRLSDKLLPWQLNNLSLSAQTMDVYDINNMLQNQASIVWTGTMDIPDDHNRTVSTAFPIAQVIPPGRNGIFLVVAENAAQTLPNVIFSGSSQDLSNLNIDAFGTNLAVHWVVTTDLALTSMWGSDGLHVFARSLATAQTLPNVDVRLIAQGQDTLGRQNTDKQGQAFFPAALLAGRRSNAAQTLIAYGPGQNFAFQNLTGPAFDLSDRGVSGRQPPKAFQVFAYTERGIYRPGETIQLMALLRDRLGDAIPGTGLKFVLRRPDGVADRSIAASPAIDGGFYEQIRLSATAARGMWTIETYVDPTAPPVGQIQVDVEDFVPQELKVTLSATPRYVTPSQAITAHVTGAFLYGAPAAGLHAQGDLRVVRDSAPIANAPGYSFGLVDDKVSDIDQTLTLGDANNTGTLDISAPLPNLPQTSVPLKAILTAGLFEPSGRYVSDAAEIPIRADPLLIGIKPLFANGQVASGESPKFDIAAFDSSGAPVAKGGLTWTLVREDQIYDWFEDNSSNWTFHYTTQDHQIASGPLGVTAGKPAGFTAPGLGAYAWGTYRLIVSDNDSGAATSVRFNIGWDTTGGSAGTPDKAQLSVEKPMLKPGETTRLHIQGPFAGPAQVVIGNDRVFSTQMIAVAKGGTTIDVTADASWGAGAYVIVTMVRPLAQSGVTAPVRALGVAYIAIDPSAHKLGVMVSAPPKITPRQTVTIPVTLTGIAPGATPHVTLAAVDEGVLQLTRYKTPDPLAFLYGKLTLGLDIRDDYGNLLDGSADVGDVHEGGDSGALGGPGLAVESTKVIALFSGPVTVGPDGVAKIAVKVPDFEGQLRLMAVAYDATQVGQAQATMIVRDPVIEDVAVPRFLAPGDTAQLAVSLHNTDGVAGTYHLAITGSGAASLHAAKDYTLAVGQRIQGAVVISAKMVGVATVDALLTGPQGYRVDRDWQIAVRAAHYPVTLQNIALQTKGADFKPEAKLLAAFTPGSLAVSIGYAGYKGIDVPSLLQSLWLYPYGCTEQLSSTAFPLLYYNQAALLGGAAPPRQADWGDDSNAAVKQRVQQAIDTILDRQGADGVFGLWTVGDGDASNWLNTYVMDFLIHAKAAGFAVPDDALNRGFNNLSVIVAKIDSGASNPDDAYYAEAPQATLAYAEYILALNGQADIGLLRRYHDAAILQNGSGNANATPMSRVYWVASTGGNAPDENSLAEPLSLAQMSGALALMGDKGRADSAMQRAVANLGVTDYPVWWFDDAYYTEQRDLAGMIRISADEGDNELANSLVQTFDALHVSTNDLNTQDKAWLLAASYELNKAMPSVSLTVNGQMQAMAMPVALLPTPAQIAAGYDVVNSSGHDLWRTFTVTGAPAVALPAIDQGYSIHKNFYALDGKSLDPSTLKQNDRFIVSLSGSADDDDDHRTVVVDMLPAGWEIEAPITDDSSDYSFLGPLSQTRTIEARDDRFVAAFDLGSNWPNQPSEVDDSTPHLENSQFQLAYIVRVVTPGSFTLPEAVVNDMYRPALMGRTTAGHTIAAAR
jgi:alpha-2-macroglobulin